MYAVMFGRLPLVKAIVEKLSKEQAKEAIEMKIGDGKNCLELAEEKKSSSEVNVWDYLWTCCKGS